LTQGNKKAFKNLKKTENMRLKKLKLYNTSFKSMHLVNDYLRITGWVNLLGVRRYRSPLRLDLILFTPVMQPLI